MSSNNEIEALHATVDELRRRVDLMDLHTRSLAECLSEWLQGHARHEHEAKNRIVWWPDGQIWRYDSLVLAEDKTAKTWVASYAEWNSKPCRTPQKALAELRRRIGAYGLDTEASELLCTALELLPACLHVQEEAQLTCSESELASLPTGAHGTR